MKRVTIAIVILLAILVLFSACRTPAGRSTGTVVDDATITSEVKAKLLADSVTKGIAVSVETFEGQVTLTGAVDTEAQRERAVKITKSVKGVKKVNDLINLKR